MGVFSNPTLTHGRIVTLSRATIRRAFLYYPSV